MTAALALARSYGVAIRFADLGAWGPVEMRAEYDPALCEIRLNAALAQTFSQERRAEFVALAVGHELYHHREAIGEIPVLPDRRRREAAATEFARGLLERPP